MSTGACEDNDACLVAKPAWGARYTCANSASYCETYPGDLYECCPKTCNTCPTPPSTPPRVKAKETAHVKKANKEIAQKEKAHKAGKFVVMAEN